jgi:tetratricopeptide (TPR) repeat protein
MKRPGSKNFLDLPEELGKAIKLHQNGKFQQAKTIYKKIIRHSPRHPEALHMLGIIYSQTGKFDTAIDLMRKSIKSAPGRPDYLFNLVQAFHGRADAQGVHPRGFLHILHTADTPRPRPPCTTTQVENRQEKTPRP